jgi:hypothetical protein
MGKQEAIGWKTGFEAVIMKKKLQSGNNIA